MGHFEMHPWSSSSASGQGLFQSPKFPATQICAARASPVHIQTASGFPPPGDEFFWDAASPGEGGNIQDQPPALLHLMETSPARSNPWWDIYGYFTPVEQPGVVWCLSNHIQSGNLLSKMSWSSSVTVTATSATSPVPAQPLQPAQGMLPARIPPHSPSHGWLLWLLSALPPHLPPLPTAGRILFGSSAGPGGTDLEIGSMSCREMEKFNTTGAHLLCLGSRDGPWGWEKHSQRWEMISHSWAATPRPQRAGMGTVPTLGLSHPTGRGSGMGRAGDPCCSAG